jgi:GT2 family glycosyltransferase
MNEKLAYVIILNWNGGKDTAACVESCRKLTYPNFRILIVDNGSTDGSERMLRERFPDIAVLQTGRNLGFAGGNNAGIRRALADHAEYIWLLNNDTVVDPAALTELVKVVEGSDRVGMAGSKIYFFDRPDELWYAGGWLRFWNGTCGHRGQRAKDQGQYDDIAETEYVTGCSLLVPARVVRDVGLMDERFFLLFEETDWNLRVKKQGYRLLYVPTSKVWHKVSASLGGESPLYHYYVARNSLLFIARQKPVFLFTAFLRRLKDVAYFLLGRQFQHAYYALLGLRDFAFRRFGQMRQ